MSNQRDYFEWLESEAMDTSDRPLFGRGGFAGKHKLGESKMLGDKSLAPDRLMAIEDCVEFANDPRHERGLMFNGRPLRNIELHGILVAHRNDPILLARRWCESLKRYLESEESWLLPN